MFKTQALLTKRDDLTLEQFDAHWYKPHGDPLTINIGVIRHSIQNARLAAADDITTAAYHGMPQVWFDSFEDMLGLQDDPNYAEADADQVNFMDSSKLAFLMLSETAVDGEVGPGDARGVNLMVGIKRAGEQAAFDAGWIGAEDAAAGRALGAERHICSRAVEANYADGAEPVWDGVRELFFPDLDALRAASERAPEAWAKLTAPAVADPSRSALYVATQRRLK